MLTQINLSEEEIRKLNYGRFQYPCVKVQKDFLTVPENRANAFKTVKGRVPGNTFGRNPRSARRSGFPLQSLARGKGQAFPLVDGNTPAALPF
jgi:hypothetical protein